jgi:hypothetical protein
VAVLEISLQRNQEKNGLANLLLVVLRRMIALFFLVFTIFYWARIVGLYPTNAQPFNGMSVHWQVASVVLSVALPTAAIGLWGLFSWGTLSWLAVMGIELTMFIGMSDKFGQDQQVVIFHLTCLATYFALKLYLKIQSRKKTN